MSEENSFGGRMRRYATVTTKMSGVAARLAGERFLGIGIDRDKHAAELTAILGGIKGPLMKVGQLIAVLPDVLPEEYARELRQLQSDAPAMGWPFVKRRMQGELGPGWQSRFAEFGQEAAAAASLGQVHKAKLHDGRAVAVKLQYPDMASAVEADLKQLKLLLSLYERADKAISTGDIHLEIGDRLREELDYDRERRHIHLYREILAGEAGVSVPEPIDELSTNRLLTMTWLDGVPLLSLKDAPLEQRNRLAYNLFRAWYVPFYRYGIIHGDPHPGNYAARADDGINLLDFGCIRVFQPRFVNGVIELYHALDTGDRDRAIAAYETWGFTNLSTELVDVLNQWASFLYGPILENRTRLIQEAGGTEYGKEVASKVHAELRRLGGVKPPREFVFMDRAAIGLGSVFTHLQAQINWYELFHDLAADFDADALAARQSAALAAAGVPEGV
ncbi:ABC transporter ATP-binding protein [Elstera litoralis]|uniref:ABC transporter ATP-binding protein n=1 Tax=Elstera litoralis TaxID=552518 RepID=A0A0F3IRU2_9PROT|nr:AarF/ABC1/UbiB kinase family protein [Elstera litoralis]KJV09431.1 ABC transporter ATP-binding protein [Elstera litoralis]